MSDIPSSKSNPSSSPRKRTRDGSRDKENEDPPRSPKKMALQTTTKLETPRVPPQKKPKGNTSLLLGDSVPFDIHAEIFSYLPPDELLKLSRLSKYLRAILMSKTARSIWKTSLSALPPYFGFQFPPCPPDLSEPQYASLVFDTTCLHCDREAGKTEDLGSRERLCRRCKDRKQNRAWRRGSLTDFAHACGVSTERPEVLAPIFHLVPRSRTTGLFCPQIARGIYQQCMTHKKRVSGAEYATYLHARRTDMEAIKEHARVLGPWHRSYYIVRDSDAQEKRSNEIVARLAKAGWSRSDFPRGGPNYALWDKLVVSKKPLTDEEWTSIKPRLEEILSVEKASRPAPAHALAEQKTTK